MKVIKINEIPIIQYNSVIGESKAKISFGVRIYDGFYISFNNYDYDIYGDVTTALVLGQMEKFFILNGDHTEAYRYLIKGGFAPCMDYFRQNAKQINKFSDKHEEV